MGKISPVSIKYVITAKIKLSSIADKSDVIGAIFGQTEGLIGSELELRELQKTGKIGRIDVNMTTNKGAAEGEIIIPSSMGKSETAIVAASIETIDRVGPCNAKINVKKIEDIRVSKRDYILKRAEELLKNLVETLPDSTDFKNKVTQTVRTNEIKKYGKEKLAAGPNIGSSNEIVVVEGRADVITLLKYGIKNTIAMNGSRAGKTVIDLMKKKVATLFLDGDRGGDLILKKMSDISDVDFVARAPDGKEVEELTMKEIQKALRSKEKWENMNKKTKRPIKNKSRKSYNRGSRRTSSKYKSRQRSSSRKPSGSFITKNKKTLKELSEDLIGTKGAYLLDRKLKILGKVPVKELKDTLSDMSDSVATLVLDKNIDSELASVIDKNKIKYVITKAGDNKRTRAYTKKADEL